MTDAGHWIVWLGGVIVFAKGAWLAFVAGDEAAGVDTMLLAGFILLAAWVVRLEARR